MKALVFKDKVVDLHKEGFPVHKDWVWVDCADTVKMGDSYEGGVFTSPAPTFTPIQDLRKKRNALLAFTDWRDLPSYAGSKQAEWRVYRQALRDITAGLDTVDKVNAVIWPTKPE